MTWKNLNIKAIFYFFCSLIITIFALHRIPYVFCAISLSNFQPPAMISCGNRKKPRDKYNLKFKLWMLICCASANTLRLFAFYHHSNFRLLIFWIQCVNNAATQRRCFFFAVLLSIITVKWGLPFLLRLSLVMKK